MGGIAIRMFKAPGKWEGFAHAGFLPFVDALRQLIQLSCLGLGDDAIHVRLSPFQGNSKSKHNRERGADSWFLCVTASWEFVLFSIADITSI